jgi:hypothetical protein
MFAWKFHGFRPEQDGGHNYEQVRGPVRPGARRSSERICTVAVPGGWVSSGDGDLALRAHVATMFVAVDGAGNLGVRGRLADTIRVVAAATGRFYGVRMTGGDIYLVADTAGGFALGGLLARVPLSDLPVGVAADPSCGLIIGFTTSGPAFALAGAGAYFAVRMAVGHFYRILTATSEARPVRGRSGGRPTRQHPGRRSGPGPRADRASAVGGRFYGRPIGPAGSAPGPATGGRPARATAGRPVPRPRA